MEYAEIVYTVEDHIATVSLNRPEARNGYTVRMSDELADAFDQADSDERVRVVVFTGEGDDFCVGADLSQGGFDFGPAEGPWQEPAGRCSKRVYTMNKPVIAAIRGAAVGAGITITLACDYRLAAADARFGFVFARRGVFPEGGSAWFLPRLVSLGTALDWMISGRVFGAGEAKAAGLVQRVHQPGELLDKAYELAREIAERTAPVSVAVTRQLLYRMSGAETPFPAFELESKLIAGLPDHADAVEGVLSFFEKRAPRFPLASARDLPPYLPWLS
ncbi:enoyl-CoA hydratase-related protein [Amycolatopsis acidiphila]|uniref:Enoyl-CoA hydratase n=1 Tax=Amycolatopsis acidiphila TaxID=715473 RepID=A0A558A1C3_9PSEU|nr:enoyl-CoA hydratase-related protein [Amycolatopsis acidiphila]TVT18068.1 enoyl-CoA hydratase [Amycolatopsis acidiphila]UIJ56639.1 enoyl-CoA hydratase-related protein [Amycolatopsis acidiphila]GHG56074.1 enoyl-CoA hydratase [Amycolatopsis acidiphila]